MNALVEDIARASAQAAQAKVLVGLIGAGIARSLTPAMQEEEARAQGLRLHYQLIDLDRGRQGAAALPGLIDAARTMGFAGLNITFPCKQAVLPLLDDLSDEARTMGAVNTVVFAHDGKATGHNTDGSGWAWGFQRALPQADLTRVVLLGTGGAGSAISHAALRMGVEHLVLVDMDPVRAKAAAAHLGALYGHARVSFAATAAQALGGATGLIHATPTGMAKLPGLPLEEHLLRPSLWVSEIVYFPLNTALLQAARKIGCATVNGGTMAVGQAVGAFQHFTGHQPDPQRMEQHFLSLIGA
jgi:shikimate dehydrogenase